MSDLVTKTLTVEDTLVAPTSVQTLADINTGADARIALQKGAANGIVPLDGSSKIAATYLPSYVDDVLEFVNLAGFPVTGETGKMYVDLSNGKIYRWSGSVYVEISASPGSTDAVPEGATNLYFTLARVLSTALTGFVANGNNVIAATDTILQAFQKAQGQITARALVARQILNGYGITGGGDFSADRTLAVSLTRVTDGNNNAVNSTGAVTAIANLTLTNLPAGNWWLCVTADVRQTADALGEAQLYKNGVAVAQTLRGLGSQGSFGDITARQTLQISIEVSSNGTDDFDVRWADSVGTLTMTDRTITAIRVA